MSDGTQLTGAGGGRAVTPFRGREPGALDSAFSILEEVARSGAGVSAREIAENLGLPRATAYRLLKHLVQQEYLVRSPDLSGFALGQRVRDLAIAVGPVAETGDDDQR
ncbi:helix-turn-helix domain-containing protein [Nocardioides humi]|uniref:HTH iclR-type domain-containing protein n=1 Tax=Nocardioides humi TaxID=449461 RepID=A0ABN2C1E5_9ACTN|nr:helix-turn-helix domain-containing protein [Nocardioides humi]